MLAVARDSLTTSRGPDSVVSMAKLALGVGVYGKQDEVSSPRGGEVRPGAD